MREAFAISWSRRFWRGDGPWPHVAEPTIAHCGCPACVFYRHLPCTHCATDQGCPTRALAEAGAVDVPAVAPEQLTLFPLERDA
jgi:hypothetical protein